MDGPSLARAASLLLFAVDLDGRAIGTHDFHVETRDDGSLGVRSTAAFGVRVLGVPVYRYRHDASEEWTDGCLRALSASTDDNGRKTRVVAQPGSDGLTVTANDRAEAVAGCVRSFAYWRPQWLTAPRLLNPQTGLMEPARLTELGTEDVMLPEGRTVAARHLRLEAGKLVIDLWYGASGEWLQLVSTTPEGRHLRYRRRSVEVP